MSRVNGDKSRFNRVRKQNAAKRMRNRKLLQNAIARPKRPCRVPTKSRWWHEYTAAWAAAFGTAQ